jgi:hypothetical protein
MLLCVRALGLPGRARSKEVELRRLRKGGLRRGHEHSASPVHGDLVPAQRFLTVAGIDAERGCLDRLHLGGEQVHDEPGAAPLLSAKLWAAELGAFRPFHPEHSTALPEPWPTFLIE